MMKIKYMLNRTMGAVTGMALTAPAMMNMVSAEDDITNITLDNDGTLNVPGSSEGGEGTVEVFNTIYKQGNLILSGITGVLTLVMIGLFTWKAFNLSKSSDSPQERAKAIQGLIFYFIGAACFGATTLFASLGFNLLR